MSGGPVIGYSDDGLVIFTQESMCEGKKAQIIMQWEPEMARHIGTALLGAAGQAERKRNERNGADTH